MYRQMIERLEDLEDTEWARDYEVRKASGQLTPEELDTLPLDKARAEIDRERAETRKAG